MISEFKVGDRVVCIDDKHRVFKCIDMQIKSGEEYIINKIIGSDLLGLTSLKRGRITGAYFCSRFRAVHKSYSPTQIGDRDDDI